MVRSSTSAAGVRFLASVKEGRGLKRSVREAGVHQEVGYRWLRECYLRYRRSGSTPAEAEALLGFSSVRVVVGRPRSPTANGTIFASVWPSRRRSGLPTILARTSLSRRVRLVSADRPFSVGSSDGSMGAARLV